MHFSQPQIKDRPLHMPTLAPPSAVPYCATALSISFLFAWLLSPQEGNRLLTGGGKSPPFHTCIQNSIPKHKMKILNNRRKNLLHFYIVFQSNFFSIIFPSKMFNSNINFSEGWSEIWRAWNPLLPTILKPFREKMQLNTMATNSVKHLYRNSAPPTLISVGVIKLL